MFETYMKLSFILIVIMAVMVIVGLIPLMIIQTYLFKKKFDPLYFNEKYFSTYELSIFNSFPLYFLKTLAYIRAIVFPKTMLKRFSNKILTPKNKPFIYLLALSTIIVLIYGTIVLINFFILGILMYFKDSL